MPKFTAAPAAYGDEGELLNLEERQAPPGNISHASASERRGMRGKSKDSN